MQIKHGFFFKKIFIHAHTLLLYTPVPVVVALRLAWCIGLPTHRQRIRRGAASIQDTHRHTKPPRTHAPTHAPGTPYPSHRSRPRRTTPHPLQGAPGPPTRIYPAPPAPRARRRPRSVAAGFPRERHFSRAVHRLKISVLALFSYHINKTTANI